MLWLAIAGIIAGGAVAIGIHLGAWGMPRNEHGFPKTRRLYRKK
jgi:hypothetical protein